jgi:glycine dehydrogenase
MIFKQRHIGITQKSQNTMLLDVGYESLDHLCEDAMAKDITYNLPPTDAMSEQALEKHMHELGKKNTETISLLGQGFYPNYCPAIIRRNILENPSWYTQYTPYQAEISQGRLEALFNFQTVITELTGLPVANASLLDEGNAASEAAFMALQHHQNKRTTLLICDSIHAHNARVIKTRFKYLGITVIEGPITSDTLTDDVMAIVAHQFKRNGDLNPIASVFKTAKEHGIICILNTDLLALTLFESAKNTGADIAIGSGQRLGVPMGFGGPSAAFIACTDTFTRRLPGRIIGLSKDKYEKPAYRMALQTREQHIRRERATSNICTAQALLAIMNSFYAVYHGPEGLKDIAQTIHNKTHAIASALIQKGFIVDTATYFDTITVRTERAKELTASALKNGIEWQCHNQAITLSLNETVDHQTLASILTIFGISITELAIPTVDIPLEVKRTSAFLTQPVFHQYYSETKLLRYIKSLEQKDLSLANAMIPLGSCTMKLNATIELLSLSNPNFANIHPFSAPSFTQGYQEILTQLEADLAQFTGFDGTSLQPNSGAQGEFSGLMCIRDYFEAIGEPHRNIAFIPTSAHGTNPASASLCGLTIVPIKCLDNGAICLDDLHKKIDQHQRHLAVLMITYPSTFGVFDDDMKAICEKIHTAGGQVYMDGANMNAQVGLTSPATIGADVCHLNLHKTFCIPHGGGGPGVGPICVKSHLVPFLPTTKSNGPTIANAPYGSASICLISYAYIRLMGNHALKEASQTAILNANYIAHRLQGAYDVMFTNKKGRVAHELIINCKTFKKEAKITVEDIAKRLMDYGFHSPTMSWPVPDSLMIEPTESEGKDELDRFCDALIHIRHEIHAIKTKVVDVENNPLKNAPHTMEDLHQEWPYPYSQSQGLFPSGNHQNKFWPSVNRIDNAFGDRNLICSCQTIEVGTTMEVLL